MSDEEVLGRVCYIPSRIYLLILAIGFAVYGIGHGLYFLIVVIAMQGGKMTPSHCSGLTCTDIISCDGTRNSSFEVIMFLMVIGSAVWGCSAVSALMNKYPGETAVFAWWLLVVAVLVAAVTIWDCTYEAICGAFSYNMIYEVILWNTPNIIVNEGVKYEVRQMHSYPSGYVNALANLRVGVLFVYLICQFVKIVFFLHAAWVAKILSERFQYGVTGMGANFSIEGWRKRLDLRGECDEVVNNTLDMAYMSCMDLEWDKNDWEMRRPLRGGRRHWYRGFVPGAMAARAYDGFRDDRRNVLL